MTELETQLPVHEEFLSPVEERHIDYILEEEFSVSPDFLKFFIEAARLEAAIPSQIIECGYYGNCIAVRSATTEDGETDVLVTYDKQSDRLPVAILIEDKIRAEFQPNQAKRYRDRGEAGKGKGWSNYWTCLVSHENNSTHKGEFDAFVSLQTLQRYFSESPMEKRCVFRADVLKRAILKYENTGLQERNFHVGMTQLRFLYASECDNRLKAGGWVYEKGRAAYEEDDWFLFRRNAWPKGVRVRHQAKLGRIDLILPTNDLPLLHDLLEQCAAWHLNGSAPKIKIVPVGRKRTKYAFQVSVPGITSFAVDEPSFEDFFAAIEFFASFYGRCSPLLPEPLRPSSDKEPVPEPDPQLSALRAMLLGFIRSTVTCLRTEMPYPLPDLRRLTAETPETERYFASPGLMGGFLLELHQDERQGSYILSDHWSRQWGTTIRHKITTSEILQLEDEAD